MNIIKFFSSSIAKKWLVAVTGIYFLLFLIVHLLGNLQIYVGPTALNQYSLLLKTFPKLIWTLRISLILALIIHVFVTISLARKNSLNPRYMKKKSRKATLASRTMMLSGLTILLFVAYHLAHYSLGVTNPEFMQLIDHEGHHHVYNMVVMGFSHPLVVAFYILAQCLLALHVSHGFSSAARSLGLIETQIFSFMKIFGQVFASIVAMLYISIPLAVLFGFLTPNF